MTGHALCALLLGPMLLASAPASRAAAPIRWTPASQPAGPVLAVALEPEPRGEAVRLAVADAGAVWVGPARGRLLPVHRVRGVRELAFAGDGSLWIASADGIERWSAEGAGEAQTPGAGPRARDVHRIRGVGRLWLAATADGLHLRDPDAGWRRLELPLPAGAATALDAGPDGERLRVGVVVGGVAYWLALTAEGTLAEPEAVRVGAPGESPRSAADVVLGPNGRDAWTLLRNGCVVGPGRACATLPPGAEARRLFRAGGRFWLATERGLLVAETPLGPWEREVPPLGSLPAHAVAGGDEAVFVGTDRGLLVARSLPAASRPAEVPAVGPALGAPAAGAVTDLPARLLGEHREPSVEEVRRAALAYLDLGPGRLRAMRAGAQRRGWLPTLALQADYDRAESRRDDSDEIFVSGGLHALFDRQNDRARGFEASVELEWDLGDILHHPESVDVSREVRELVELRDDVLDELHHLYFERRRVLLELLALPPGRSLEAARLRLRADELAAGIDAWTGGWFGQRAVRLAP